MTFARRFRFFVGHLRCSMPCFENCRTIGRSGTKAPRPGAHTLAELLDEFARLRSENLNALEAWRISPDDLERRGRHPALGVVTLSELLATWAVHDLTHLHQISRVMAYQYRNAVGPWSRYLGVLHCDGHSAPA
jgi:hypothetical protein